MDKNTERLVKLLHPYLRDDATAIYNEINNILKGRAQVRFTFTFRTFDEQSGLYALGRTKVNPDGKSQQRPLGYKVTNAIAGSSKHNYGLAIDIALLIDGKTMSWNDIQDYDGDGISDWMECVKVFKSHGWSWGGDWSSFVDKPHFEYNFGLTLSEMKTRHAKKDFIPGTNYIIVREQNNNEYQTTSGLNLREGAGSTYPILLIIPKGSKVIELSRSGEWSNVTFGPKIGWVANSYLKK